MEKETIAPTAQHEPTESQLEPQDERAEWISPAIADYDVQEATRSGSFPGNLDGAGYS